LYNRCNYSNSIIVTYYGHNRTLIQLTSATQRMLSKQSKEQLSEYAALTAVKKPYNQISCPLRYKILQHEHIVIMYSKSCNYTKCYEIFSFLFLLPSCFPFQFFILRHRLPIS